MVTQPPSSAQPEPRAGAAAGAAAPGLIGRLWSRRGGTMLVRNTVASAAAFALDMLLLWLFVQWLGMDKLLAAAIGFLIANTLHYGLGRAWVFAGSARSVGAGFLYFIINALVGLTITLGLFAFFMDLLGVHYLIARIIASVFAGLAVFLLNAVLNFRSL